MIQATKFHQGKQLDVADINEAGEGCPVCRASDVRRSVYRVQRNPDIEMLECPNCGVASASHMPKPDVLATYYGGYYTDSDHRHTLDDPIRVARHVLRAMPDLRQSSRPLRILDFGGGDGSLSVAIAGLLHGAGAPAPTTIDLVDYQDPRDTDADVVIVGHRDLESIEGEHDLILASAIFEHIPDAYTAINQVLEHARAGTYMYARTPYILPLARLVPLIDITYPGHVHDMGSAFWGRFIETFGIKGELLSSRPSLVETTFTGAPARSLVAHLLKAPAFAEQAVRRKNRSPRWSFVGGWEAVVRFE